MLKYKTKIAEMTNILQYKCAILLHWTESLLFVKAQNQIKTVRRSYWKYVFLVYVQTHLETEIV